jgi:spore maturation protein CgeB
MRFVWLTHSVLSCWNHGNAHFLRGVMRALLAAGHDIRAYEPAEGWSRTNMAREREGPAELARFAATFPDLAPHVHAAHLDLDRMLDGADVVVVHEWNDPALVAAVGARRRQGGRFRLLFHDTHHRAVTDPAAIRALDLSGYDGVLAFGSTLAEVYRRTGWGGRVWVWHEAADTRLFQPPATDTDRRGVVWIGNWGDDERSAELRAYLLGPVRQLRLPLEVWGVRYPVAAQRDLAMAGAHYRGWLPNAQVPAVFARHQFTVHVPRAAYTAQLPGIPTIRVFEALACGIPLICAPWSDAEHLFRPGEDYLAAPNPAAMPGLMARLTDDADLGQALARHGLATIRARHTCDHRAAELLAIVARLRGSEPGDTA